MASIVVLDNEMNRAEQMLRAFDSIAKGYHLVYDQSEHLMQLQEFDSGQNHKADNIVLHFDLFLIHSRDKIHLPLIKNYGARVWYGGHGIADPDAPKWEMLIRRPIFKKGHGTLGKAEAQELLDFSTGKNRKIPAFIFYPNKEEEACLHICAQLYAQCDLRQLASYDNVFVKSPEKEYWQELKQKIESLKTKRKTIEFLDEEYLEIVDQFKQNILASYNSDL